MATLDDLTDTTALTEQRFRRMSGTSSQPPVDMAGLPPGPRWPALVQTAALMRFRHSFHPWLQRTYGETFTLRLVPGGRPLVFFTRPEHVKEIFAGDPEVFHAGKGNAVLGPVMGEHSLLLQDSSQHQRARKLLMPAFNGAALRGYRALVREVAAAEVATWRDGEEFRALDRMNRLTLDVILRVVFGVTDESRLAALRPRVTRTVDVKPIVLLGWGVPWLQRFGPWRRTVRNQQELDALMYAEIRERRDAPDLASRSDVLSRLIRAGSEDAGGPAGTGSEAPLSDTELRDQLVTLLLAGHETTASALSWALFELGRHPELLARSLEAARTEGEAGEGARAEADAWLDAVMKEAMRLHPIIPMVVRTLTEPTTVGGIDLPRGATVGPSIILAHTSGQHHDRPEVFDPERFLGRNPAPNTWIPFGGGVRRCIGAGFAHMEGVEVLREVLSVHAVEALGEERPRVRNITSVPHHGAPLRVRRRR